RRTIRRVAGSRLNRLSQRFAQRGLLTIIGVRIVPVAPFTVVNLVAGASHIRFWTYMLGTLLGMTPGLIGLSAFMDRLVALVRHPDTMNFALAAGVAAVLVVAGFFLQRWLRRRRLAGNNEEGAA
ncbi:MAG TPA: VTT domain-containing protein, partial [Gammaproteobacteria bacterium]|nr:VTT domain-containing protein [Gammaproteobacteria bacterium]